MRICMFVKSGGIVGGGGVIKAIPYQINILVIYLFITLIKNHRKIKHNQMEVNINTIDISMQ